MNLNDLTNLPLSAIAAYCAAGLGLLFLLSALGVPLPSTLLVVAAGALIQQGVLNLSTTLGLSLGGVVLGDVLSFSMGRGLGRSMHAWYGQLATWQRAEAYFARRGGIAIVLTRCVLMPIAVPVNLVAGSSAYPVWRFAAYAVSGEMIWLLGYGAIGYFFSSQWETISALIGHASGPLAGVLIAGGAAYALIRWQHHATTRRLSRRRSASRCIGTISIDPSDIVDSPYTSLSYSSEQPPRAPCAKRPRRFPISRLRTTRWLAQAMGRSTSFLLVKKSHFTVFGRDRRSHGRDRMDA